jgi:small GTP-binding protein
MLQKKICMLGATAVGKTSLVRRFVEGFYSDKYQTNIGVKIDKKPVRVKDKDLDMLLWDIYGADEFQSMRMAYLNGMSGYLLVADGTRKNTINDALSIQESMAKDFAKVPFIFLLNKVDLKDEWEAGPDLEAELAARGWMVMRSSAKTGEAVEAAFHTLGEKMLP